MTSRLKSIDIYSRSLLLLLMLLLMLSGHGQSSIVAMEYYIDTDPGIGSGVAITITTGVNQDVDLAINTSGLSVGFHDLIVRARYSDGTWGIQESRTFYVSASSVGSSTNVAEVEYFFDTDPGYGNGDQITLTPAGSIDMSALISTSSLSLGFHTLFVRAKDSDGFWGMVKYQVFYIDSYQRDESTDIASVEYFIDTDPGFGSGTQYAISSPQASIDEDITVSTSSLPDGDYSIGVRVEDTNGNFSITETAPFTICSGADVDFSATTVCIGSPTEFTDLSTGTLAEDTYSWDFDGDESVDSNVVGNTTFTYSTSGTYNATLKIDQNGCVISKTVEVTVVDLPNADAGGDQNITTNSTTLAAAALGEGEVGEWSVISGTANVTDLNDPTTTVTGIDGSQVQLRWTVTNTEGGCDDSDDMVINVSDPLSSETDILSFSLTDQTGPAQINDVNHTVALEVESGTNISSLNPSITVSEGASISPAGAQNFTNPVTYLITAEDGVTTQEWVVTVSVAENPLSLDGSKVEVFPNPTQDRLYVLGVSKPYRLMLTDVTGRKILILSNEEKVSLRSLKEGVYFLTIQKDNELLENIRIIKKN